MNGSDWKNYFSKRDLLQGNKIVAPQGHRIEIHFLGQYDCSIQIPDPSLNSVVEYDDTTIVAHYSGPNQSWRREQWYLWDHICSVQLHERQ